MANNRDNFPEKTKIQIAKRAGWRCSCPGCHVQTVGSNEEGTGEINIGVAAHICAAAPGGPRYKDDMSKEDRSSSENGIWLCQNHAKIIDSDEASYPAALLHEWQRQASTNSWHHVGQRTVAHMPPAITDTGLADKLRATAADDLNVFKRMRKWPRCSVPLTLRVQGIEATISTEALARSAASLEDLILVAGPGMGKTTTLFQIAEGILQSDNGVPLMVLLNEWATGGATLLEAILNRPAFKGVSEDEFRKAAHSGVVLLLDGWNELDAAARNRARRQVDCLQAQIPAISLVVSARRLGNHALDIPFEGKQIDLLPLNDKQQMDIARAMRGEEGVRLIDQAWRTPGVGDLVAIPLYLTTLLALPKGTPFPTTKEEVLRRFAKAHEQNPDHAASLYGVVQDFQQNYLVSIATFATRIANTAIDVTDARRSISDTSTLLFKNGQIKSPPEQNEVLNVLVNSHALLRDADSTAVSFQHQQFQEWYASHDVEDRILHDIDNPIRRETLKAEIFNDTEWQEAILFAVERMSRNGVPSQAACGKAVIAAFEVDPILAAEMISRSTDDVWAQIATPIQSLVSRWHVAGRVDRAVRFMLTSGREEFLDAIWRLITNENIQTSLRALRNCRRFQPTILGRDAASKVKALPENPREVLLREIVAHSGMDGLDLATAIAKNDPSPKVKVSVIDALAFRRADRHVAEILCDVDETTIDLVARRNLIDEIEDEDVREKITAARKRVAASATSIEDRLYTIVYARTDEDCGAELAQIVRSMEINSRQDTAFQLLERARDQYPCAIADGLLGRLRAGLSLFNGADDILASANFSFEDEDLLQLALANPLTKDERADAAASVLGPDAVGKMIDALLELVSVAQPDRAAYQTRSVMKRRIGHTPGSSLIEAVVQRSAALNTEQMAQLASLFYGRRDEGDERGRPFNADGVQAIQALTEDWGKRMLAAEGAKRFEKADIATLASRFPDPRLLPIIKELHDDNLQRYRAFRVQAQADGWGQTQAVNEARSPHTREYQSAFMAIKAPETAVLMKTYLEDEHFGDLAAQVLAEQWHAANEPPRDNRFFVGVDWSGVRAKREASQANSAATCDEAEAIFAAINRLLASEASEKKQNLAVSLGIAALKLPHGQRAETIRKLISLARRRGYSDARPNLLLSAVLSGEEIDVGDVITGIAETVEAGNGDQWTLMQNDGWRLQVWLRLIPFTNKPLEALPTVLDLPLGQSIPYVLREMLRTFGHSPSPQAEDFLFQLAEADPRLYKIHEWRDSVVALETLPSARRLIDLVADDVFANEHSSSDYDVVKLVGRLISMHPVLRHHVYSILKRAVTANGKSTLAKVVAENLDEDGVILLAKIEQQGGPVHNRSTIEKLILSHIPVGADSNAYNLDPKPATELRRRLLAMTSDGGQEDVPARWLTSIDEIRDEYGLPPGEPRHPDLSSGKAWPIIAGAPV